MKRDPDLIRKILQACEDHEHGWAPKKMRIDGYSDEQVGWHVHLAGEAGLLKVADVTTNSSPSPEAIPVYMTSDGYEFLEGSRNDETWAKAKKAASAAGGMSLDVLKIVLAQLAAAAAKKMLGLP